MELQNLKGVGLKTVEALYKSEIYNLTDLLGYYPYRYQIEEPQILSTTMKDEVIMINATLIEVGKVVFVRNNLNLLRLKVEASGIILSVLIYNRAFLKRNLKIGQELIITGKYDAKKKSFTANNIKFGRLDGKKIVPIYHSIKGLKSFNLYKIIEEAISEYVTLDDYIPTSYIDKYNFLRAIYFN